MTTPETYVLKFGKYRFMKASDVANIKIIDKYGKERAEGLRYLRLLSKQDWFKHADLIEQITNKFHDDEKDEAKPKKTSSKKPKASKNVAIDMKNERPIIEFD